MPAPAPRPLPQQQGTFQQSCEVPLVAQPPLLQSWQPRPPPPCQLPLLVLRASSRQTCGLLTLLRVVRSLARALLTASAR